MLQIRGLPCRLTMCSPVLASPRSQPPCSSAVAMDLLQARRGHNRSQRRLQTRLTAPLLLWAAVDALLLGLTWQLQKDTATRLVPIKASHILLTQRPWTQEAALRLVMHVENSRLGLSRAQTDVEGARFVLWCPLLPPTFADGLRPDGASCLRYTRRDALARASREMLKAAYGLIYGSEDLLGLYNIPGGTAFRVTALLPIFFDSACYAVSRSRVRDGSRRLFVSRHDVCRP